MSVWRLSLALLALVLAAPAAALGAFPYKPQGAPEEYDRYFLPAGAGQTPNDLTDKRVWMYASTAHPQADPQIRRDRRELLGVRGAHLADASGAEQAWHTTTGRPDVTIAVLDSGIKWNDLGAMEDIRRKTRLAKGELSPPLRDRASATEPGQDCATFRDAWDANADGVFNVVDYACDSRVSAAPPKGVGPVRDAKPVLDPQDVLIAFSDGSDADANGYVDDIVGWDFLDDDNDPFDDVQYGHGTGEARDSAGEADNGGDLGTCPNCMEIHLRVGTSFIADVNRFALAVLYAADNDVEVVQEALGTLNKSQLGADAVRYAYEHGTVVIASAADEAAQHHNWPSSYPYSIVVNSVTHSRAAEPATRSYLELNGCTNFSSRITLAIPSVSCSSDATGRGAGMAGIVYSAALNAIESGTIAPHPTCRRTDGAPCPISANEVRQLMASALYDGRLTADDVNFAQDPETGASTELSCRPLAVPGCTDPFAAAPTTRVGGPGRSYPARRGHDQFYGHGRVNMVRAVRPLVRGQLPPEVEVTGPEWFETIDPERESFSVTGEVDNRGRAYSCRVLVAPGSYASDVTDFVAVPSPVCNGEQRSDRLDGELAQVAVDDLEKLFPAVAGDFRGRESGLGEQPHSGRPNTEPYGFVVKVVAEGEPYGDVQVAGQDRRQAYLHRDQDMLPGFPKHLPGDGEASPTLADLDGDNANELILANSDGLVYAFRRDGSQLDGFPVRTDVLPLHPAARAFASGAVAPAHGAVLATPAVGDLDRDAVP
ncbi:MAG: S8 family serine peptidase, partial [Actinomycetes bacterium]